MVEVRPHGKYQNGFIVQGHANYAPHGADVVCSAISAVSQMVADELNRIHFATVEYDSGYLNVINHTGGHSIDLIKMLMRYLKMVEKHYPDSIKIFEEEEE